MNKVDHFRLPSNIKYDWDSGDRVKLGIFFPNLRDVLGEFARS